MIILEGSYYKKLIICYYKGKKRINKKNKN